MPARFVQRARPRRDLVNNPHRLEQVLYRPRRSARPGKPDSLDWAMDRIAELVRQTRDETWIGTDANGVRRNHTLGIGHLGGATLDNEENYLIKKLFTVGLGMVAVENQARI